MMFFKFLWWIPDGVSGSGSVDSGSDGVAVVPLDWGDRRGSNDTKLKVAVAVLTEIRFIVVI
jgi:hypothetical protein